MNLLAFFVQSDLTPDQQHTANALAGLGIGVALFLGLLLLAILGFLIYCLWRIFTKAGLAGPLAFLVLVPGVGGLIVLCILAFAKWNVVPVTPSAYLPPSYPPPPSAYPPPPSYPPAA